MVAGGPMEEYGGSARMPGGHSNVNVALQSGGKCSNCTDLGCLGTTLCCVSISAVKKYFHQFRVFDWQID